MYGKPEVPKTLGNIFLGSPPCTSHSEGPAPAAPGLGSRDPRGPVALRAWSSEPPAPSSRCDPEVAGTGVRLRLRGETSALIKTFFAFVKENNTLHFEKLHERGPLSLPGALVLLSPVWKENTAALQTNTGEKGTGQPQKKGAGVKCSPKPTGQPQASAARTLPGLCSLSAAPQGHRPGPRRVRARWHQAPRAVGWQGARCDTCVPAHAGPKHRAHLADVCGAHTTPSPWPGNCQENTSKSCFLTASHLYFSFVPLS